MTTETENALEPVRSIQIAGSRTFLGHLWRDAITIYLNGIWQGNEEISHRPKIVLNGIGLRLHGETYVGYLSSSEYLPTERPRVADKDLLVIPQPTQAEVENGLIRFVRNSQIRQLGICFPDSGGVIAFTKGLKPGNLFITAEGSIPTFDDLRRRAGYIV